MLTSSNYLSSLGFISQCKVVLRALKCNAGCICFNQLLPLKVQSRFNSKTLESSWNLSEMDISNFLKKTPKHVKRKVYKSLISRMSSIIGFLSKRDVRQLFLCIQYIREYTDHYNSSISLNVIATDLLGTFNIKLQLLLVYSSCIT